MAIVGSNTLGNIARAVPLRLPTLRSLGLDRVVDLGASGDRPRAPVAGAIGRMAEVIGRQGFGDRALGDDGHRARTEPFPVFPDGFSTDIIAEFSRRTGRAVLGNKAASGTDDHRRARGRAHANRRARSSTRPPTACFRSPRTRTVVPVPELYRACEIAYTLVWEGLGVGRVIARPFVGAPGSFTRTANRHDYALPPRGETLLDRIKAAGIPVVAIGKIEDLFAGRGITHAVHTASDDEGMDQVERQMQRARSRPDLREPGRLRHAVRASQRRRRVRGQSRAVRRAPGASCCRGCARTICWS